MFFSKKSSLPHPILRDFPWLWAVKSLWSKSTQVSIYRLGKEDCLSYWTVAGPDLSGKHPERMSFYVMADWGVAQEVRCFQSHLTTRDMDLFEAIEQVDKLGMDYQSIRAVVVRCDTDDRIVMFLPKEASSLSSLFIKEERKRLAESKTRS